MQPDRPAAVSESESGSDQLPGERRLASSRAELESLFVRDPEGFPRSRTMRFLLGRGGIALATGALAGLMMVKPGLASTVIRILPVGRVARRLL
jgi:hypothetical protein